MAIRLAGLQYGHTTHAKVLVSPSSKWPCSIAPAVVTISRYRGVVVQAIPCCGPDAERRTTNSREAPKPANTIMQRLAPYRGIAITFGALLLWSADAAAEPSPAERRGLRFVRLNCARCHAVDKVSPSPLANAPPFRTLHLKYPVSDLQRPWLRGSIR